MAMPVADSKEVALRARVTPEFAQILTPEAMRFLGSLARRFESTRTERLAARVKNNL